MQAMLAHNDAARRVELVADRPYSVGEPLYAWCGPQPNSRLLLNYVSRCDGHSFAHQQHMLLLLLGGVVLGFAGCSFAAPACAMRCCLGAGAGRGGCIGHRDQLLYSRGAAAGAHTQGRGTTTGGGAKKNAPRACKSEIRTGSKLSNRFKSTSNSNQFKSNSNQFKSNSNRFKFKFKSIQGIVDESNPFDKLQLTVTLPSSDPLFKAKRARLDAAGLSTMQVKNYITHRRHRHRKNTRMQKQPPPPHHQYQTTAHHPPTTPSTITNANTQHRPLT